jgi:cytohesin
MEDLNAIVNGHTMLTKACRNEDQSIVNLLLEHGADPNIYIYQRHNDPLTPLKVACMKQNTTIITSLLNSNADPNDGYAGQPYYRTSLHEVTEHRNLPLIELLLDAGSLANIPSPYQGGFTAFEEACCMDMSGDIVETFLKYDVKTDRMQEKYKMKAIHMAAANNRINVMRVLLEYGVDINSKDGFGDTSLHHAAYNKDLLMYSFLLMNGADDNERNDSNKLPIDILKEHY